MIKKTFFIISALFLFLNYANCQIYPQYEYYSNYDISSLTGGVKNCVEEAQCIEYTLELYKISKRDNIDESDKFMASLYAAGIICHNHKSDINNSDLMSILYKVVQLNDRQRIDLLSRLYEIENTCYIKYRTVNDEKMNKYVGINDDAASSDINVNFGTALIENSRNKDGGYTLKFASPITKIDAQLFSAGVVSLSLPKSHNIKYLDNARKDVSSLSCIEGLDVESKISLVSRDSVLVVAAVADMQEYTVPMSVKVLGIDCLRNSNLCKVYIPASVKIIKFGAFENCANMCEVYIEGNGVIEIEENAFDENNSAKWKIYVPKNFCKLYKKRYPFLRKRLVALK